MIRMFKTHCKLPDGTVGEVCKKFKKDEYLVCNNSGWWACEKDWILNNEVKV